MTDHTNEYDARQVWFPDDQHGYSIALCECEDGPYLGARQMGRPCVCERCLRITPDQWDFICATVRDDRGDRLEAMVDRLAERLAVLPDLWRKEGRAVLHNAAGDDLTVHQRVGKWLREKTIIPPGSTNDQEVRRG